MVCGIQHSHKGLEAIVVTAAEQQWILHSGAEFLGPLSGQEKQKHLSKANVNYMSRNKKHKDFLQIEDCIIESKEGG